jgi:hypothetical protein
MKTSYITLIIKVADSIIFEHLLLDNNISYKTLPSFEPFEVQHYKYIFDIKDKEVVDQICITEKIK